MSEPVTAKVEIKNALGLHIRPSRQLASLANSFDASVIVRNKDREAAADSQLDLLMLVAGKGSQIEISATGGQAAEAVAAIVELIDNLFGEEA